MHRLIAFALVLLSPAAAFAVTPSQIAVELAGGHLHGAERMSREALSAKPSARVHFLLSKALSGEGRHAEALLELQKAEHMDPSLSFSPSPASFHKTLMRETADVQAQSAYRAKTAAANARHLASNGFPVSAFGIMASGFGVFIVIVLGWSLIDFILTFSAARSSEERNRQLRRDLSAEQLPELLSLSSDLHRAHVEAEIAAPAMGDLRDAIADLRKRLLKAIGDVRNDDPLSKRDLKELTSLVRSLGAVVAGKIPMPDDAKSASATKPM